MISLALLGLGLAGAVLADDGLAITHVELVAMDAERVQSDYTVLIRDDRIVAIGPSGVVTIPEGVRVLDGTGKYLMPGLADMHVHSWFEDEHLLFVANGVTTVRNMFGSPQHVRWRDEIAAGKRFGPTLYTAGPIVDGKPPFWPGSIECESDLDGIDAVFAHSEVGYDFVKVYTALPASAYESIVAAAAEEDLPVMGHVPVSVGLFAALAAGQRTIEHFTEYARVLVDEAVAAEYGPRVPMGLALWEHANAERITSAVEATRSAGTWNCPTLVVTQKWLLTDEIEAELARSHVRFISPLTIANWRAMSARTPPSFVQFARASDAARKAFVLALHDGGARLLLGTDQGNPFVAAGVSVHEELRNFVDAGLTPYEALRTGTFEAAACMDATDEFGTVREGARADLLLLESNPLEDVAAAGRIAGVVLRGKWLSRAELDERMEARALRHAGTKTDGE